jgi:hypothetical protein
MIEWNRGKTMKFYGLLVLAVLIFSKAYSGSVRTEHGKVSSEAWQKVFSKMTSGFSKRPLIPGVTILKADGETVKTFHRFFPALSEVIYQSCATQLESGLGAQLPLEVLQEEGVVVIEPTVVLEAQSKQEGVLLTWTRLLTNGKVQELHQETVSARSCDTDKIAKRLLNYGQSQFEKLSKTRSSKTVELAAYVHALEGAERVQARAQSFEPSQSRGRMPASLKGP